MRLYNMNSAKFYEKLSVRIVYAVNPIRNSAARNNRLQKKQIF